MLCLSDRPGLIFPGLKYCTFNMASIWRLCLRLRSKLFFICVWCLLFYSRILLNIKHKQLDLTSITSNVVAGLRSGHVHVFTRSLQSKATSLSLGLVMYLKKQSFFFFQEIITL